MCRLSRIKGASEWIMTLQRQPILKRKRTALTRDCQSKRGHVTRALISSIVLSNARWIMRVMLYADDCAGFSSGGGDKRIRG